MGSELGLTTGQLWTLTFMETGRMRLTAGLLSLPTGFVLSLVLAILSSRSQRPNSILRDEFRAAPAAAPAPVQVPGTQPQQGAPQQATPQQAAPATTTN